MATDPCSTVFWFTDLSINGPSTTISSTTVCSITFCWPKNWTSDLQYVSDKTYVQRSLQLCYSAAKILTRWKLRWDEIFFFFFIYFICRSYLFHLFVFRIQFQKCWLWKECHWYFYTQSKTIAFYVKVNPLSSTETGVQSFPQKILFYHQDG